MVHHHSFLFTTTEDLGDCFSEEIVAADQDGDAIASNLDDCIEEEEDLSSVGVL